MKFKLFSGFAGAGIVAMGALFLSSEGRILAQERSLQTPPVEIVIRDDFEVPPADSQTEAITQAALAFLDTLDADQRAAATFEFTDNTQRSNWSNFPDGPVRRQGVMRGDMTAPQLAALDDLLQTVMSDEGYRNIVLQLAAEETLDTGVGGPNFGDEYYYAAFLGQPATDAPWMFQFGGHHLAINVTIVGPDLSFSPMLTGGEPLKLNFQDRDVVITERETLAAQALMDSLSDAQKAQVIRGDRPINLLLGPGEFGAVLAPEGLRATELDASQRALLVDVISARLGFINADDFAAKMRTVEAELDDTYFGWWGPQGVPGAAYFRVTAPSVVLEYAPQAMRGSDPTDHAHSMYRNPQNDYGTAWIARR